MRTKEKRERAAILLFDVLMFLAASVMLRRIIE
jgi:hypothetical protein